MAQDGLGLVYGSILITQHGLLPGLAGSRDFLFWIAFRAGTENQGFWLSLCLDTKQYHGADTNRGGPALMPALPHEALGSLQWVSLC